MPLDFGETDLKVVLEHFSNTLDACGVDADSATREWLQLKHMIYAK